jgi:hypothetical protein
MTPDPEREEEFNDWYNTEHIPFFNRLPGVITARRFRAIAGSPKYVALYHVETIDIHATRAWMAINETPWILRHAPLPARPHLLPVRPTRLTQGLGGLTILPPTKDSSMNPAQPLKVFWQPG